MKTKEELYEEIEAYLEGNLSRPELVAFESRMEQDPELKQQVSLHQRIAAAVADQEEIQLENTLQEVVEQEGGGTVRFFARFPVMRYAAAAAIALLIAISIWWSVSSVLTSDSPQELFAENYEFYPGPASLRGSEDPIPYNPTEQAFLAYQQHDFQAAKEQFSELLAEDPTNTELIFFQALCNLELDNTNQARTGFGQVIDQGNNFYLMQSRWYLALAWLKEGNSEEATTILSELSQEKGKYARSAEKLLEEM